MKQRHPITQSDAATQAEALANNERFCRDIGVDWGEFIKGADLSRFNDNGSPKYVACFDNGGKTADRYTVVFTHSYRRNNGRTLYLAMSEKPFHPLGFGQHGECEPQRYGWKGDKRIDWCELPDDCRRAAMQTYREIWSA